MFILKLLSKLLKALQSADSPNQLAWGFALGAILGLTPLWNLHNILIILLIFILKVNLSSALFSLILFSLIAWIFDPLFHTLGFALLVQLPFLQSLWNLLYNAPVLSLSRFNDTIVMGSLFCSLILLVPNFLLFRWMVVLYRRTWNESVKKWRLAKILKSSKAVRFYQKVKFLGGK
ncbi:TIGR03546 family protein [bacterium]|nr:TIGR03546 family protein [bacterium]RQV94091.1 MAG: TIGR03546 family protein [bacterium]